MNPIDLAYAAGIIDGDGWIGINCKRVHSVSDQKWGRHVEYHMAEVQVGMADPIVPYWLHTTFGGSLSRQKTTHRDTYKWHLTTRKAVEFLIQVMPYLKLKQPQAQLAVQLMNEGKYYRGGSDHTVPEAELERRRDIHRRMLGMNSGARLA